jgi:hypothetical protein
MVDHKVLTSDGFAKVKLEHWKNIDKQNDLLQEVASNAERNAHTDMSASPYWSLMWDTTPDITRREQGNIYIRHLDASQTRAVQTFVKLVQVPDRTAEGEEKLIRETIQKLEHPPQGAGVAAGLDGAAVNMGCHQGLAVRLGIPMIHCGGHKINLTPIHVTKSQDQVAQVVDHLQGIATDLWASSKAAEEFRSLQQALGQPVKEFLYSPKTRWLEIRKVCERYLVLIGELDLLYDQRSAEDIAVARGRLNKVRNVRYVYMVHLLVDLLLPLKIVNKCQQSNYTLICEWKSSISGVISYLTQLQQTQGATEILFWKRFSLTSLKYTVGNHTIQLIKPGGRRSSNTGVSKELENLRESTLQAFLDDLKTYSITDPWQIFDILSFPGGDMKGYGDDEITKLYNKYSDKVTYLSVSVEGKQPKLETVSGGLLEEDVLTKVLAGWQIRIQ